MPTNLQEKENKIELGALQSNQEHIYDVSLPLSLDSTLYPKMNLANIKAWYLFMSIVKESTPEEYQSGICSYTFPALDFAKAMNMPQPRGARVNRALTPLARIPIQLVEGDGIDAEKQNIVTTNLLMRIVYKGKERGKPITVWIDPVINNLIFHSKQSIDFDYLDIVKLTSVASIRVFTVLWRLHQQHTHVIEVEHFKELLGVAHKKSERFSDFARTYITPVEADIRTNTSFKDFRFSYSGLDKHGKKVAIKTLYFSFDPPEAIQEEQNYAEMLEGRLSPEFFQHAQSFSPATLGVLVQLTDKQYAVNTYMNLILKVIHDCTEGTFRVCSNKIIMDAGKNTMAGKYGKILTKELKKLLSDKKPSQRAIVENNLRRYSYEDQQKMLKFYEKAAKQEAESMTVDERQRFLERYRDLIDQHLKPGQKLNPFDILSGKPDRRRASYRAFVACLAELYRNGQLKIQPHLF